MNTYTIQFFYLIFILIGIGCYLYDSYKLKLQVIKFAVFYNSYLKTVISIKIENNYFGEKERLWHGKDSVDVINEDDLTFLFTRSLVALLDDKRTVQVVAYFYFSDEFRILGQLDTKISPKVNEFIDDKKLEGVLKRHRKNPQSSVKGASN